MKRVRRVDSGGTLAKPEKLSNGWLRVEGRTALVGILEYDQPDGTVRRELVLPEDLFEPESLASARMVPVTNRHPEALLTDQSARAHQVGSVGENLRADGEHLVAPLMITDATTIAAIGAGRQELSWGYDCDLEETSGTHPTFGRYDAIQRRRRYNHLACVDEARAGSQARMRLDSAGNACPPFAKPADAVVASDLPASPSSPEIKPMPQTIRIDGRIYTIDGTDAVNVIAEIERVQREHAVKLDAAEKAKQAAEKERADSAAKLDGFGKRVKAWGAGVKAKLDAMMKRDVTCDECGGGKVDESGGKCPSCDGMGTHSARDAIKAMPQPEGAAPVEEDVEAMEDALRETPAEEALEKAANPEHADAARKAGAKARADARATARQRRADGLSRRADRRAKERATLIVTAGRHLGAEEKIDGLSDLDVRRKVVGKLAPHVGDVAKMDAATVGVLYDAETKRADAGIVTAPMLSPSDALRISMTPPAGGPARPATATQTKADAMANAYKTPGVQPTLTAAK